MKNLGIPYRLELLQIVPAYFRQARQTKNFDAGALVYYGPHPAYYGIGEVKNTVDGYVAVDFRGTGQFGVHEEILQPEYLISISPSTMALL